MTNTRGDLATHEKARSALAGGPLDLREEIGVDLRVFLPFGRQGRIFVDRFDGAFGFARAARNALAGIDIHLRAVVVAVNAIHRANLDARLVFHADARLGNYISHCCCVSPFSFLF